MNATKIIAILLIVAGTIGLAFGGFNYTKETEAMKLGSLELTVKEQKSVAIPLWASIGAIVLGAGMLVIAGKKS